MLVLDIEYLAGTCFAALGPDSEIPDWPPQPDRVYSALTATWAARGQNPAEGRALEWLENLPPPSLLASEMETRSGAPVFVPPNDPRTERQKTAGGVLPALRARQARRFPAARPHDPVVRMVWSAAQPDPEMLALLTGLANDTAYVGHSASLTRCRFGVEAAVDLSRATSPQRRVYPGRFVELQRDFEAGRRPQPGAPVSRRHEELSSDPVGVFDDRWLILEHLTGEMPDIRASALVSKAIRTTLMSGYRRRGWGDNIPEIVSGHTSDGRPSLHPHLAIAPLAFAGFPYADGHVIGFALIPPRGTALLENQDFLAVLRELAPIQENINRRLLIVAPPSSASSAPRFAVGLAPVLEAARLSLDPQIYTRRSRRFASVTPVVLDRHLKERGGARQDEIAAQLVAACRNIGLPEPSQILVDKHSAIEGAASAYPSGKAPRWTGWRLPGSMATRQLTHAVICFSAPVRGPIILGTGRYCGMGLCRPVEEERT